MAAGRPKGTKKNPPILKEIKDQLLKELKLKGADDDFLNANESIINETFQVLFELKICNYKKTNNGLFIEDKNGVPKRAPWVVQYEKAHPQFMNYHKQLIKMLDNYVEAEDNYEVPKMDLD